MFDRFDKEWAFVADVWLDEDDFDEFHCKCVCSSKELKQLNSIARMSEEVALGEPGLYDTSKAARFMDEMVAQSSKLADFKQRAYRAALEGAKEYIKTMGKRSEVRPEEKDMMEAPDIYSLRVTCHYYNRDIL